MTKKRAVITGIGLISALGKLQETWEGILERRHNFCDLPPEYEKYGPYISKKVAWIQDFNPDEYEFCKVKRIDRFAQLGLNSVYEAIVDSKLDTTNIDLQRTGVFIGSALGSNVLLMKYINAGETSGTRKIPPYTVPTVTLNSISANIAIQMQAKGPNLTVSTACSSSNHAIGLAYDSIAHGVSEIAICGGSDSPDSPIGYGFHDSLRAMVPGDGLCTPFSKNRQGFVVGEGAGILVIEELEHALKRNAKIYAEIVGYSATCDAYDMVKPQVDGEQVAECMRQALRHADVSVSDVDYINAHGTGTYFGDLAEVRGIRKVFGERATSIPVSSIKGAIGHTLGASGAMEAAIIAKAFEERMIPPTVNLAESDEELGLDFVPTPRSHPINVALSNSFGFGGNNSTLVFKKYK